MKKIKFGKGIGRKTFADKGQNSTRYRDEFGRLCVATTHDECSGKGCERCNGRGFIVQYELDSK